MTGLLSRKSLLAGLIVLSSVVARAETKLGFVDVQKAIQATTAGKKAKETLDAEFGNRKKDLDKKKAVEYIKHHDLDRQKYVRKHFDCDIADPKHYDLVINTDNVSVDEAVELIASLVFKIKETGKK